MGNVLKLLWWLLMLSALQASACVLDGFRYIGWGLFGYLVLKGLYLAFAGVLLFRYRSFQRQRAFEGLAESYQRMAGKDFEGTAVRRRSRLNPILTWALLALAVIDVALAWVPDLAVFRITIGLDLAIWLLMSRWVSRACWLRSRGARERLKEAVDDARSRARSAGTDPETTPRRVSPAPFIALAALSLAFTMALGGMRWADSEAVFRLDDLQQCMDLSMRDASARFYQQGETKVSLAAEPCVKKSAGQVDFSLEWSEGELRLRVVENPDGDYFGDGTPGNEGLALDGNGNFRALSDRKRPRRLSLP
ncbi:MAG: hypothetical protein JF616_22040 [Fibrobacteres bacterium]|nr:hypothetical protein [Fibrobacterota bacterium]